ncbi:MAG: hypothetical protein LBB76_07830 [Azoarcus sp.]|jgi:hypothetical protein|nr:hypothetical protein [Azoarcus sp.]
MLIYFHRLPLSGKLATLSSATVLALFALGLCLQLKWAPNYPDFIVGHLAWKAETKFQDLLAAPVFCVVLFFSLRFLTAHFTRMSERFGTAFAMRFASCSLWWTLPALLCPFLDLGLVDSARVLCLSAIATAFLTLSSHVDVIRAGKAGNPNAPERSSLVFFTVLLLALIPLEILLALGRAAPMLERWTGWGWTQWLEITKPKGWLRIAGAIGLCALTFALFHTLRACARDSLLWPRLALLGQWGMSLLYLCLYPAKLLQPNGEISAYQTTVGLKILVLALVAWGIADAAWRYRIFRRSSTQRDEGAEVDEGEKSTFPAKERDWSRLYSPVAIFGLLLALKMGNTLAPLIVPDDYHFGEFLLGVWSYLHGALPYVDYFPAHGLIDDDMPMFLSVLFYDGFAGSGFEAHRLARALLALAAFLAIYRFSGSLGLAGASVLLFNERLSFLFLAPLLWWWTNPESRARPARWLAVWLLCAPILILGLPAQGLLLIAASSPLAAHCAWRLWLDLRQHDAWRTAAVPGAIVLALGLLGLLTPLGTMLRGAILYVMENAPINQVAYGVPWSSSWNLQGGRAGLLFELSRMAWVLTPLACLALLAHGKERVGAPCAHYDIWPARIVLVFVVLMIPYTMGRIDPGAISRPGAMTALSCLTLLPLVLWPAIRPDHRVLLVSLTACIAASLGGMDFSPRTLTRALTETKITTLSLRDGTSAGLTNIGKAQVEDEHWDRLVRLNALLNAHLEPGAPYLDLTSRNAHYFYLDRHPVVGVSAPYNMVSIARQKQEVERLKANLPDIALLEADNIIHDGGGLALRNPYLYRFVVDHYIPRDEGGFIVGYSTSYAARNAITIERHDMVKLFRRVFGVLDIGGIAVAWGRSGRSLLRDGELLKSFSLRGERGLVFELNGGDLSGVEGSLLGFDFICGGGGSVMLRVGWKGRDRAGEEEKGEVLLMGAEGWMLVDLGMDPGWLLLDRVEALSLALVGGATCNGVGVGGISFFRRY